MHLTRRGLITGLASFLAAPAIVRASSIMPVKAWAEPIAPGVVTFIDPAYDERLAQAIVTAVCPDHLGHGYYASLTDNGRTFITQAAAGALPEIGERVLIQL